MQVEREKLLEELETVEPGTTNQEVIEQSSCFIFRDGKVATFNNEVACTTSTRLNIEGAVRAAPMMKLLRQWRDPEIDVEPNGKELIFKGHKKSSGIAMEKEITSPFDTVEKPEKWRRLPEEFLEAVGIVQNCAKSNDDKFLLTVVHIHPEWVEACDNVQAARYYMKIKLTSPTIVRRESIKHVVGMSVTHFSETDSWLHFKNSDGLVFSCRRWMEDFPSELSELINNKGTPFTLPKGFSEAVKAAQIFSKENGDLDRVTVTLTANKIRIKSVGVTGWYKEFTKVAYKGDPVSFMIAPDLLIELMNRHNSCEIGNGLLMVDGGKFKYLTSLYKVDAD